MNKLDVLKILMENVAITVDAHTPAVGQNKLSLKVGLSVKLEDEWYEFSNSYLPLGDIVQLKD